MCLAINLYKHFIDVPAPVSKSPHPADPLPLDVSRKQWAETVPPHPDRFVTNIDAALCKQVFDIPQRRRKSDIYHHHKPNHARSLAAGRKMGWFLL